MNFQYFIYKKLDVLENYMNLRNSSASSSTDFHTFSSEMSLNRKYLLSYLAAKMRRWVDTQCFSGSSSSASSTRAGMEKLDRRDESAPEHTALPVRPATAVSEADT